MNLIESIVLQNIKNINKKKCFNLLDNGLSFEDIVNLFNIPQSEIDKNMEYSKYIIDSCYSNKIDIVSVFDDNYPEQLKILDDMPFVIYKKGKLVNKIKNLAVVGTRNPIEESILKTYSITRELANDDFSIISGLAYGIDTTAHKAAVDAGGYTIAILPSSLNNIYPKQNEKLAHMIIESNGCLLSEYPPGRNLEKYFFIQRDRLQAVMSKAVLVIESENDGGTMHTARFCKKYNKVLFCLKPPVNIDVSSSELKRKFSGNMKLMKDNYVSKINDESNILNEINRRF